MKQFPSLPCRNQFQATDISGLRVLFLKINITHHLLHLLVTCRGLLFHLGLDLLQFLLVGDFQTLRNQVLRYELRKEHLYMVQFFPEIVYTLHQNFSLLAVALELLFQLGSPQQFLLEIQLLEKVSFMIVDSAPYIIDPVTESVELGLSDRDLLDRRLLEFCVLVSDQVLEAGDLLLFVLEEGHYEGLQLKVLEQFIEIFLQETQSQSYNRRHIKQLKCSFALKSFFDVLFKNITLDIFEDILSGDHNVGGPVHPNLQNIKPQINRILHVVYTHSRYVTPFQEERIPIDFSNILNKDQNFRIDKSEFQSDVQADRKGKLIPHRIEMANLFFSFLLLFHDGRFIVYLYRFFHPFILEPFYLRTEGDTGQFECDLIAIDASGEQLQGISVAKTEQIVHLRYNNTDDSVLLLLPKVVGLEGTADDDVLVLDLSHLLHVQVYYRDLGYRREDVMQGLREVL